MKSVEKRRSADRVLLFMTFSFEMIVDTLGITLPIFALSLSASPFEIGLLAASRGVVYSLFTFVSGYISDKLDKRRMLTYSLLISIIVAIFYYFSANPFELIILSFFQGLATAIFWPTMEALVANRQDVSISRSLRNFNVSWAIGVMIGPFIGGCLITLFGIRTPFPFVIAIAIMNVILISRYASQERGKREPIEEAGKEKLPMKLISMTVILGAMATIFLAFFPAFGVQRGISAFEIGVMLFLFGVARVIMFYKPPSTKLGLQSSIILASLGLFLVYLGDKIAMYVGTFTVAAGTSLLYVYSIEHFLKGKEETRGRRAGIFEGSAGIGAILGSFFAGLAAELSLSYAFLMASVIGLVFVAALRISRFKA
jgi:MFS family permease